MPGNPNSIKSCCITFISPLSIKTLMKNLQVFAYNRLLISHRSGFSINNFYIRIQLSACIFNKTEKKGGLVRFLQMKTRKFIENKRGTKMELDCNTCEHTDKKISQLPCLYCDNGNLWEPTPKQSIHGQINRIPFAPMKGPVELKVRGSSLVVGRGIASKIYVTTC